MTFEELWKQVKGLPDTAMGQVPIVLSSATKRKLCRMSPSEIEQLVRSAIEEVNRGSIEPLDKLINNKL